MLYIPPAPKTVFSYAFSVYHILAFLCVKWKWLISDTMVKHARFSKKIYGGNRFFTVLHYDVLWFEMAWLVEKLPEKFFLLNYTIVLNIVNSNLFNQ